MAKSVNLNFPQNVNNAAVTFVNADSTDEKVLFMAGANDSRVISVIGTTTDTSANNVKVMLSDGTNLHLIGTVRLATLSGTDGAAVSVDILNSTSIPGLPVDANGKRYIPLKTGWSVQVAPLVAVTAAKLLTLTAIGEDY